MVSNHPDHADACAFFGVPFHHLPGRRRRQGRRRQARSSRWSKAGVDLRRAGPLHADPQPPTFVARYPHRIINIHHSFLPAFVGAKPYHQAHERGVKVIGATAHYATADLDEGPIIEQDVARVTHRDVGRDLVRTGRDLERLVLARAVRLHLDAKVLVYGNRTVVFG